jgi:hypothetical protein
VNCKITDLKRLGAISGVWVDHRRNAYTILIIFLQVEQKYFLGVFGRLVNDRGHVCFCAEVVLPCAVRRKSRMIKESVRRILGHLSAPFLNLLRREAINKMPVFSH